MNFSIVFENTGDSIPFKSMYPPLVEYYVDYLDKHNLNSFEIDGYNNRESIVHGHKIQQAIDNLKNTTIDLNQWIDKITDCSIPVFEDDEYLNQHNLNRLHADWVNSHLISYDIQKKRSQYLGNKIVEQVHELFPDDVQFPTVGSVISRLGLATEYGKINLQVHKLESLFNDLNFKASKGEWVPLNNPFDKRILTNNLSNLRLEFSHLGRTLYNKYQNFDTNLQYDDENSYNDLIGFVSLHLIPPQTIPLSEEYISWCNAHNKTPSGQYLNIGNIPDIETRLKDYRLIVFRNLLQYNSFSITFN